MDALTKRRSIVKGLLTRIEKYATALTSSSCEEEVKERIRRAKELLQQFTDIENQMFDESPEEKSEGEEFEEQYYRVVAKLNKWVRLQSLSIHPINDSIINTSQTANNEFKLPRVNIPSFTGDYREWQSFFDLFNAMVHENTSLTAAQKFQYLKGLLKGEASNLLRHFAVTEANYIEAFQKLCKRYDRKSLTANSFIKLFMDQPVIRQPNASTIRRLLDTSDEATRGLRALGPEADSKDPWLLFILFNKLDDESKQLWMRQIVNEEFPKLQTFYEFLAHRADALEGINNGAKVHSARPLASVRGLLVNPNVTCPVCQTNNHQLFECKEFKTMNVAARRDLIKKEGRCFNCLNNNHGFYDCRSQKRCRICFKKHHSLLHTSCTPKDSTTSTSATSSLKPDESDESPQSRPTGNNTTREKHSQNESTESYTVNNNQARNLTSQTLLPTALIRIKDGFGEYKLCRALLDSGSQVSFVSEDLVQRLKLPRTNARISICGIGQSTAGISQGKVDVCISSRLDDTTWQLQCLVISKVTSCQPGSYIEDSIFCNLEHLTLADPSFNQPSKVDVLLGSDQFFYLLRPGKISLGSEKLIAQNTVFGWVIAGPHYTTDKSSINTNSLHCEVNIDQSLQKFWEVEEVALSKPSSYYSEEERRCEELFEQSTTRTDDGKLIVKLPFKSASIKLGDTYRGALKRLEAIERKFLKDPTFKQYYHSFMEEYQSLKHMEEIPTEEINKREGVYYLPHHGVLRESSSTTKLRVVYDASFKSSNGTSLNDTLLVGPTLYQPLFSILLRFRLYKIVFTADVEKMFRQIGLHPNDRDYHRILWRSDPTKPPTHYRLKTVTYGTASAPYLATKSLQVAGNSVKEKEPKIAMKILHDFYVDDFLSGCHTEEEAYQIHDRVTAVLQSYGFNLRKWSSNYSPLLEQITPENKQLVPVEIERDQSYINLLGIQWNPLKDEFQFKVSIKEESTNSKREVLSQSARIFDPMGWLAPAIVKIKILFQSLWLLNLDWDDKLPLIEAEIWSTIKRELPDLEKIKIPRWYRTTGEAFELHGFSDASEKAYGAVIYSRCVDQNGKVQISLLTSKTKVAPINQVSLPRLELCAATLLAKLVASVREALMIPDAKVTLWTDSQIVLGWLSSPPRRWKTFIANRTANILTKTSRECWNFVDSQTNPADHASRGLMPSKLVGCNLWWHGPGWLSKAKDEWPTQRFKIDGVELLKEERKVTTHVMAMTSNNNINDILSHLLRRISSFHKITRVLAWVQRYTDKLKRNGTKKSFESELTVDELEKSRIKLFSWVQNEYFANEVSLIKSKRELPKGSKIRSLNPFLDGKQLMRVGGRIENAMADFETRHPVILPNCDLSKLLVRDLHKKHQHAGASLLTSIIRQNYFITNCCKIVKIIIKGCNRCQRYNAKPNYQLMGNLPSDRVLYETPFLKTGIDYAGPFQIKQIYGRSTQTWKAYIAIFVCMATKAIHSEVVSNLTSENFIAALQRFVSRRGLCTDIYSDNGSNFIGANNALREICQFINSNSNTIFSFLASERIKWHFIPSVAPIFGGLWEAAVKSLKYHLRRIMGNGTFTFEELTTVASQIEAVLNSRPLCLLSEDQIDVLTPGHLLIGRPIVQLPQQSLIDIKVSRLSRWQHKQQAMQHFSNRWKDEYLTSLQRRCKWQTEGQIFQVNDVVIIREDNLPPTKWLLGRIEAVYPGRDGTIRVVTVKTKGGSLKRPVYKLVKLTTADLSQ